MELVIQRKGSFQTVHTILMTWKFTSVETGDELTKTSQQHTLLLETSVEGLRGSDS
jgi:hypothetical protein